jgi:DNA-damage-inducible protein J
MIFAIEAFTAGPNPYKMPVQKQVSVITLLWFGLHIDNVSHLRYIATKEQDLTTHSSMLHVRMDDDVKLRAQKALDAMGLSVSDAVRLLMHRIAADQAFPLELKVPNAETRAAMTEAEAMVKKRKARFKTSAAMFADLEKAGRK